MKILIILPLLISMTACYGQKNQKEAKPNTMKTDEFCCRFELTGKQYSVLKEKATEAPFSGKLLNEKSKGVYLCACCGQSLFSSDCKYDSGSGWPSFWQALPGDKVSEKEDFSLGIKRIEIVCSKCGGHLGHVFDDGPKPTGLRYCVNSASLKLFVTD